MLALVTWGNLAPSERRFARVWDWNIKIDEGWGFPTPVGTPICPSVGLEHYSLLRKERAYYWSERRFARVWDWNLQSKETKTVEIKSERRFARVWDWNLCCVRALINPVESERRFARVGDCNSYHCANPLLVFVVGTPICPSGGLQLVISVRASSSSGVGTPIFPSGGLQLYHDTLSPSSNRSRNADFPEWGIAT